MSKNVICDEECPFCGHEDLNAIEHWWDDGVLVLFMECQNKKCKKTHQAFYKAEYLVSKIEDEDSDEVDDELGDDESIKPEDESSDDDGDV